MLAAAIGCRAHQLAQHRLPLNECNINLKRYRIKKIKHVRNGGLGKKEKLPVIN